MKEHLSTIAHAVKRFNQVVLVFPVWLVLGLSGLFKRSRHQSGWQDSEKDDRYEKMY